MQFYDLGSYRNYWNAKLVSLMKNYLKKMGLKDYILDLFLLSNVYNMMGSKGKLRCPFLVLERKPKKKFAELWCVIYAYVDGHPRTYVKDVCLLAVRLMSDVFVATQ